VKESSIEGYLHQRVVEMGGTSRKFVSPGTNGVADRLCFFKPGQTFFVELKAPGKKEDPDQVTERRKMEGLGFICFCCDSYASVDFCLARIRGILAKTPTAEQLDKLQKENDQLRASIRGPIRDTHATSRVR